MILDMMTTLTTLLLNERNAILNPRAFKPQMQTFAALSYMKVSSFKKYL